MTEALDPRIHAYRADLAARGLAGRVEAAAFADGAPYRVTAATAAVHDRPDPASTRISELLYGEAVSVYEVRDGWAWLQSALDDYVGYVRAEALAAGAGAPDHRVAVLSTHLYPEPRLKAPPRGWLPLGARLAARGVTKGAARGAAENGFLPVGDAGWVYRRHLAPLGRTEPDFVATAARFLGVPYLWGGRSVLGLDCSGLVQVALQLAGIACPRDSDMMAAALGQALDPATDPATLARGDLIFMAGHVMFADGDGRALHANAHHMAVTLEPVAEVFGRLSAEAGRITAIRRLIR